jgi:Flp pilus assembly pilin Flp
MRRFPMTPSLLLTRCYLELRNRFVHEERGASTVEYALVVVAVAALALVLMGAMGTKLTDWFRDDINLPDPASATPTAGG